MTTTRTRIAALTLALLGAGCPNGESADGDDDGTTSGPGIDSITTMTTVAAESSTGGASTGTTAAMDDGPGEDECRVSGDCGNGEICAAAYEGELGPFVCSDTCVENFDDARWCGDAAACCDPEASCNAVGLCDGEIPTATDSGTDSDSGSDSGSDSDSDSTSDSGGESTSGSTGGSSSGSTGGSSSGSTG